MIFLFFHIAKKYWYVYVTTETPRQVCDIVCVDTITTSWWFSGSQYQLILDVYFLGMKLLLQVHLL